MNIGINSIPLNSTGEVVVIGTPLSVGGFNSRPIDAPGNPLSVEGRLASLVNVPTNFYNVNLVKTSVVE